MATAKYRDNRIRSAEKILAGLRSKRQEAEDYVARSDGLIETVEERIEWLKSMPVDDEAEPEKPLTGKDSA